MTSSEELRAAVAILTDAINQQDLEAKDKVLMQTLAAIACALVMDVRRIADAMDCVAENLRGGTV